MRRLVLLALVACGVVGSVGASVALAARAPVSAAAVARPAVSAAAVARAAVSAAAVARAPARLLVYGQEWSLWPSRGSVPAGRVVVQFWNRGQDAHDLHIRRLGRGGMMVGAAQAVPVTESGQIRRATWRLRRGTYELYCSMPGHMKMGMHARLTVR